MAGSSSQLHNAARLRDGSPSMAWKMSGIATGSPLARLRTLLLGRRPAGPALPPLKNAHYVAVHMAATTRLGSLR